MVSLRSRWLLAVYLLITLSSLDLLTSSVEGSRLPRGLPIPKSNGRDDIDQSSLPSKTHEDDISKEVKIVSEQPSDIGDINTYRPRLRSEGEISRGRILAAKNENQKKENPKKEVKKRQPPRGAPPPPKNSRRIATIPPPLPPPPKNIVRTVTPPSSPPPPSTPEPPPRKATYSRGWTYP